MGAVWMDALNIGMPKPELSWSNQQRANGLCKLLAQSLLANRTRGEVEQVTLYSVNKLDHLWICPEMSIPSIRQKPVLKLIEGQRTSEVLG
jgi:hypothetical protein